MAPTSIDWPFPDRFRLPWRASSAFLKLTSHLFVCCALRMSQRIQTKNLDLLKAAIWERPKGTPLVTISNHSSCLDDPGVWGVLPIRAALLRSTTRWTPVAEEVCFSRKLLSMYFARCQGVPVIRGDGVYQRGMNFCLKLLNEGNWVHIFPEGKINVTGECMRLKWGVGRLIAETEATPLVVPFWHVGMDDILPNKRPYFPQFFKKLTVLIGDPIDFSSLLAHHHGMRASAVALRKQITDVVQDKLVELRMNAEELHRNWTTDSLVSYRAL